MDVAQLATPTAAEESKNTFSAESVRRNHSPGTFQQQRKRGKRISILGLWQPQVQFDYGLVVGSFNTKRYLRLLEWQACKAAEHLAQTVKLRLLSKIMLLPTRVTWCSSTGSNGRNKGYFSFFFHPIALR